MQLQLALREQVISVDTQKKELVVPFKIGGRELRPKGAPEQVLVHDFLIPDLGRVSPHGVYDIAQNEAWVSVGTDHDTAAFAVESIRRRWRGMGQALYASAIRLLITAFIGGRNGYRLRLWKLELQKLADETGLEINVCHLPPGTSKWNKIEHRLFSAISQNWRGKPHGEPRGGSELDRRRPGPGRGCGFRARLDANRYPAGRTVCGRRTRAIYVA